MFNSGDFPGGPVVKNPPGSAGNEGQSLVGEIRSICQGAIKTLLRDYWAHAAEPECHSWSLGTTRKDPTRLLRASTKTQRSLINKYFFKVNYKNERWQYRKFDGRNYYF